MVMKKHMNQNGGVPWIVTLLRSHYGIKDVQYDYIHMNFSYRLLVRSVFGVIFEVVLSDVAMEEYQIEDPLRWLLRGADAPKIEASDHVLMVGGPKHGEMVQFNLSFKYLNVPVVDIFSLDSPPDVTPYNLSPMASFETTVYRLEKLFFGWKAVGLDTQVMRVLVHESVPVADGSDAFIDIVRGTVEENLTIGLYPNYVSYAAAVCKGLI